MRFQQSCAAVCGLVSLAASVPTGLHQVAEKRSPLVIQQNIQETNIIVVNDNQAELDALQQVAEQQFAQLVQAQIALATQLQAVKDNIRINHFKARFSQVNAVIVTVSTLIDARAAQGGQNRYMVNQLMVDNGKPENQIMVMISDAETMTLGAAGAASSVAVADISTSVVAEPTAMPIMQASDPAKPYGEIGQKLVMPIGAAAPVNDLVFADPAAIILPNQADLFVESATTFGQACGFFLQNDNAFLNVELSQFTSFQQVSVVGGGDPLPIVQQQEAAVDPAAAEPEDEPADESMEEPAEQPEEATMGQAADASMGSDASMGGDNSIGDDNSMGGDTMAEAKANPMSQPMEAPADGGM